MLSLWCSKNEFMSAPADLPQQGTLVCWIRSTLRGRQGYQGQSPWLVSQPISIRKASAWRPIFPSQHLTVLHVVRIFLGNACTSSSASTLALAENSTHRDRTGQLNTAAH